MQHNPMSGWDRLEEKVLLGGIDLNNLPPVYPAPPMIVPSGWVQPVPPDILLLPSGPSPTDPPAMFIAETAPSPINAEPNPVLMLASSSLSYSTVGTA